MERRSRRLFDCVLGTILWHLGPSEGCCGEDCNRNGIPDSDDVASSLSQDCNDNGVPDECEQARVRLHSTTDGWKYDVGTSHETVALDFNGDDFSDLLTGATRGPETIFALRLNDRRGGFAAPLTYAAQDPLIAMLSIDGARPMWT